VGIGEALFDIFPEESRLGGAPLNVAVHARQLGNAGVVVSRVGQDDLGETLLTELKGRGMDVWHIQRDPDNPTGTVYVDTGPDGSTEFEIVSDVAWDYLQWDGDLEDLADHAAAVCFGTLAQREAQTRNTIYRFLAEAKRAVRLLDVNLRQDFYDRQKLRRSMELASAVKMNVDELRVLADLFNLGEDEAGAVGKLMREHELDWAAVTRGEAGTTVYAGDRKYEAEPASAANGGDAVGAGDATAAALLHGTVRRWPWERTLTLANTLGAYVAGQAGACPPLSEQVKPLAG